MPGFGELRADNIAVLFDTSGHGFEFKVEILFEDFDGLGESDCTQSEVDASRTIGGGLEFVEKLFGVGARELKPLIERKALCLKALGEPWLLLR